MESRFPSTLRYGKLECSIQTETAMTAHTVLEELTGDELTREHVAERVDDWASRIENLYDWVSKSLPTGWKAIREQPIRMHEEVMRSVNLPVREVPTLALLKGDQVKLRLRPYVLWSIGANGRIDVTADSRHYKLYDQADIFTAPDWKFTPVTGPRDWKKFDREQLLDLLAA